MRGIFCLHEREKEIERRRSNHFSMASSDAKAADSDLSLCRPVVAKKKATFERGGKIWMCVYRREIAERPTLLDLARKAFFYLLHIFSLLHVRPEEKRENTADCCPVLARSKPLKNDCFSFMPTEEFSLSLSLLDSKGR